MDYPNKPFGYWREVSKTNSSWSHLILLNVKVVQRCSMTTITEPLVWNSRRWDLIHTHDVLYQDISPSVTTPFFPSSNPRFKNFYNSGPYVTCLQKITSSLWQRYTCPSSLTARGISPGNWEETSRKDEDLHPDWTWPIYVNFEEYTK